MTDRLDVYDLTEEELRQVIAELIRHAELVIRRRGSSVVLEPDPRANDD